VTAPVAGKIAAALMRGTGLGALGCVAAAGLIAGEAALARVRIPKPSANPPVSDGTTWVAPGVRRNRRALHLCVLGDSTAAGLGVHHNHETLAAQVALLVSAASGRPVRVTNLAVVGARSSDLRSQIDRLATDHRPDLSIVMIGANDVTHRVSVGESVRHLAYAVHRLALLGGQVIVGVCPDLGAVRLIPEPLRSLVHRRSHTLAAAQTDAVRRVGGRPIALFDRVCSLVSADRSFFSPDGFHPSAAGYRAVAEALLPDVLDMLGVVARPTPLPQAA
jgi:lysophospholipase L1-like esterase